MERRQFGIVVMPKASTITARNNRAGFNGTGNSASSLYFGGQVGDIYYQVQGNTLLGDQVVHHGGAGLHARHRHDGRSRDGGDGSRRSNGGDHRCNCGNNPLDFVPCDNKTAHVAYIAIAEKDDAVGRHAQRRQVLRLHQRHRRRHQGRRERQPGEDAAHALRRVEEGRRRPHRAARADAVQARSPDRACTPSFSRRRSSARSVTPSA